MKTFKQLRIELEEADYTSAWQRVKSGVSQIGAGASEAGKTFIKRDVPIFIKKGEQTYQKTIKPVAKKVVGTVGGAMEMGGKELKKMSEESDNIKKLLSPKQELKPKPFNYDSNKLGKELRPKPFTVPIDSNGNISIQKNNPRPL